MSLSDGPRVPVLVADDHGIVRDALAAFVRSVDGFELVGTARNGAEAVALASERHPRLVVMDVSMPGIDGVEATRKILMNAPELGS